MVPLNMKYLHLSYLLIFVIFGFTNPLTVTRQAKDSYPNEGFSCKDPHSSGGLGSSTCTCNPDHATIMSPMRPRKPALCSYPRDVQCYHSLHKTDNTYLVTKTHLNEKIYPPVPENIDASIIQIYLWNTDSSNHGIWLDITPIGHRFFKMNIKSPQDMNLEMANLDLKYWQGHLIIVRFGRKGQIYQPCLTLKMSGNLTYPFDFEAFKAHSEPPTTTKTTTTTMAITTEIPTKPTTKITTKTTKRMTITEIPTKPTTTMKEITTKAATTIKTAVSTTPTTTPTTTTTSTEPQTTTSTLSTTKRKTVTTTQKVLTTQTQKTMTPIITKPKTQKVSSTRRAKTTTSTTSGKIKSAHTVYYAVLCPIFGLSVIALLVLLIRTKFLKKPIRKSVKSMEKLDNTVHPAKDIVDINTPM